MQYFVKVDAVTKTRKTTVNMQYYVKVDAVTKKGKLLSICNILLKLML